MPPERERRSFRDAVLRGQEQATEALSKMNQSPAKSVSPRGSFGVSDEISIRGGIGDGQRGSRQSESSSEVHVAGRRNRSEAFTVSKTYGMEPYSPQVTPDANLLSQIEMNICKGLFGHMPISLPASDNQCCSFLIVSYTKHSI